MRTLGEKWSRHHDVCQGCGSDAVPHLAHGFCKTCESKDRRMVHEAPVLCSIEEWALVLARVYSGSLNVTWALLDSDWENDNPKKQSRWRARILNELEGMSG